MKRTNIPSKYALLTLVIISFLLLVGCSTIEDDIAEADETFKTSEDDITKATETPKTIDQEQKNGETHTTLDELIPAVCELSVDDAIEQYFDQYYYIGGTVKFCGDLDGTSVLMLNGPQFAGSDYSIMFLFDDSNSAETLKELHEGDSIVVRGYLSGSDYKNLIRFNFYHCTVSKVSPIQTPQPPEEENDKGYFAQITVVYEPEFMVFGLSFSIYIDNIEVGEIINGNAESFSIYIGTGEHILQAKPNWSLDEFNDKVSFFVEGDHQTFSFIIRDDPWAITLEESTDPKKSEFYLDTQIPTIQSITDSPCTASLNESGNAESAGYLPGYASYLYDDINVEQLTTYLSALIMIGAEETRYDPVGDELLATYEFEQTTISIHAYATGETIDKVVITLNNL